MRSRRFRKLLNLIDRLPRNSHYAEAIALDEELAARLVDVELPPFTQRFSEWSVEAEFLAGALEQLQRIGAILIKAYGGHPDPVVPMLRPVPATTAARSARKFERHHELVRRLVPVPDPEV